MRLGRAGIEGEGAAVAQDRLLHLSLPGQDEAELGCGQSALGLGRGGAAQEARSLVQHPLLREHAA